MHVQTRDDACSSVERMWTSERQYVRRMLIGLARDIDLADDLLQETYLKARDGISGYRGGNGRAWLCTIARNAYLAHIRRRYVTAETGDDSECTASYSPVGTPDHLELMRVRNAVSELDPDLRIALLMRHYCGFTYREIAQSANCPVGTAKWRVSAAVGKLRDALGVEGQMEMKCADLSRTGILDYCYGALKPSQAEAVRRHVRGCPRCQSRLDDTIKVMSALDAMEDDMRTVHIVELDKAGIAKLYMVQEFSFDGPGNQMISFCASKGVEFEYMGVRGEELAFTAEENDNPNYPHTLSYQVDIPESLRDAETHTLIMVARLDNRPAVREPDGSWRYSWSQLTSVEHAWAYVLSIRLPADSRLLSVEPPATETMGDAGTTLMWRTVHAANEWFSCEIRYRVGE